MMDFIKGFSASVEMIMWFLSFSPFVWLIHLLTLYIELSLNFGGKANLVLANHFLLYVYILVSVLY